MLARLVSNSCVQATPALASWSAGITGVSYCARPNFILKWKRNMEIRSFAITAETYDEKFMST